MERVGILIEKLQLQFSQEAERDSLMITAQMLLAELQQHKTADSPKTGVSVLMPMNFSNPQTVPMTESPIAKSVTRGTNQKKDELSGWLFDMHLDLPVIKPALENQINHLGDDKETFELNDSITSHQSSLNDHLKSDEIEVLDVFQEIPIRDLKKAIGINDRYLFINELFRGDETMYERSLKTINGFDIFPEAQYWIQRELKVKLGWNDHSETVDHFDQIVKRRFA